MNKLLNAFGIGVLLLGVGVIVFAISMGIFSCYNQHQPPPWRAAESNIRDNVKELFYQGHSYLMYAAGGILHSESCPCKTNKITLELPSSRVNATQ